MRLSIRRCQTARKPLEIDFSSVIAERSKGTTSSISKMRIQDSFLSWQFPRFPGGNKSRAASCSEACAKILKLIDS
jgi:hypothetical protein